MVRLILLLAALPMLGADAHYLSVPFRLYTVFQHEPPAAIQDSIRHEVDAIMSPLGWTFKWSSTDNDPNPDCIILVVVHFKGECGIEDLTEFASYPFVLGRTEVSGQGIGPFVDIYCDAVRAHLAGDLRGWNPKERSAAFGRAVGRVVAHELYHVLAQTQHHASKGLGKAAYTPRELLSDNFRFEKNEVSKLRAQALRVEQRRLAAAFERAQRDRPSLSTASGVTESSEKGTNAAAVGGSLYNSTSAIDK